MYVKREREREREAIQRESAKKLTNLLVLFCACWLFMDKTNTCLYTTSRLASGYYFLLLVFRVSTRDFARKGY